MNRLFYIGNKLIKIIFYIFIFLTLYFALVSNNLLLKANKSTTFTYLILGLIVALIILYNYFLNIKKFFHFIFVEHKYITSIICFILSIIAQVIYVINFHPAVGFDAGAIHDAVLNPHNEELRGYFSLNSNNLPILLLEENLSKLFRNNSWFFYSVISIFFVDISALLNIWIIYLLNAKLTAVIIYIESIWLFSYPMAIIAYTDNWVLPLISLYVLLIVYSWKFRKNNFLMFFFAFLAGVCSILAYFLKPSGIIPMLGIIIYLLFSFLNNFSKSSLRKRIVTLLCLIVGMGMTLEIGNNLLRHQTYIPITWERKIPAIHFIQIGMTGNGGYNSATDNIIMGRLYTKKEKTDYSVKRIKKILQKKKLSYINFLVWKHGNNTSDGTFGWLGEGQFFKIKKKNNFKNIYQEFLFKSGKELNNFRYMVQLIWIIFLVFLAFSWKENFIWMQVFRLGMIGAFVFLLIFEGGRSRYLIQFLPILFLLTTLGFNSSIQTFKNMFTWKPLKK